MLTLKEKCTLADVKAFLEEQKTRGKPIDLDFEDAIEFLKFYPQCLEPCEQMNKCLTGWCEFDIFYHHHIIYECGHLSGIFECPRCFRCEKYEDENNPLARFGDELLCQNCYLNDSKLVNQVLDEIT